MKISSLIYPISLGLIFVSYLHYEEIINQNELNRVSNNSIPQEKIGQIQEIVPTAAIIEGPTQPEVQSFRPFDSNSLVDPFTGDFSYNIPLLDVGGYPLNLFYNSNVGVEEEASCVGLGWNINPGVINREVRGLPDDFDGDEIIKDMNLRPNWTLGMGGGVDFEFFGVNPSRFTREIVGLGVSGSLSYNNYSGFALQVGLNPSIGISENQGTKFTAGLGLNVGSATGISMSPSIGLSKSIETHTESSSAGFTLGTSYNSLQGSQGINFNVNATLDKKQSNGSSERIFSDRIASGTLLNFANNSYSPNISFPLTTISGQIKSKIGGEIFGAYPDVSRYSFGSLQMLSTNQIKTPAYGYLYAHKTSDDDVLHDFTREKDSDVTPDRPNLGMPIHTYDTYSVSGQGVNGAFRPFRGDIGTIYDPKVYNQGGAINLGLEVGGGNLIRLGGDLEEPVTLTSAGKWKGLQIDNLLDVAQPLDLINPNQSAELFKFQSNADNSPQYEPFYFKNIGEKTVSKNEMLFESMGGFDPVRVNLKSIEKSVFPGLEVIPINFTPSHATKTLTALNEREIERQLTPGTSQKTERENRSLNLIFFTAAEMAMLPDSSSKLFSYQPSSLNIKTEFSRVDSKRKPHHISAIQVTKDDGSRYMYGIPAYNNYKAEVSFNVRAITAADGEVSFESKDDSISNEKGVDNYYAKTTTPAYAYAYLLTSVLSNDYVDIDGNGPSERDLGSYTKFNYNRRYDDFKWRTPRTNAYFDEGLKSSNADQKANYTQGSKEVWHVSSVETRNYFAFFHYSDRLDTQSPTNQVLQKLDSIQLFTRSEIINKRSVQRAIPMQTVHLIYDYSLCKGAPGSPADTGKLTLLKLYTTYQNSPKGKAHPYTFSYSTNPDYRKQTADRWGRYKPNQPGQISNERFPFAVQSKTVADSHASAWLLNKIKLPTSAELEITYESDDYGYIQNKPAMQMLKIKGFAASQVQNLSGSNTSNTLYNNIPNSVNNYLYFELPNQVKERDKEIVINSLKSNLKELYYNALVENLSPISNTKEYVEGFIPLPGTEIGLVKQQGDERFRFGWIKIPQESVGFSQTHPIARDAWQFMRLHNIQALYQGETERQDITNFDDLTTITNLITSLFAYSQNYASLFAGGFNPSMLLTNRANTIDLSKSYIRLNVPIQSDTIGEFKYGGGSRVKSLKVKTNWVVERQKQEYITDYDYTIVENGIKMSAGVAAFEPFLGKQENPFFDPIRYGSTRMFAPDDKLFQTEPYGESVFPGPGIGYRKVSIRMKGAKTGYAEKEFYTAKDFPTIARRTACEFQPFNFVFPIWISVSIDMPAVSQGYYVETNDMHGKPKQESDFDEKGNLVRRTQYVYKTDAQGRLNNEVKVVVGDEIKTKNVGIDWDMVVDARTSSRQTLARSIEMNIENFILPIVLPIPVVIPVPLPSLSYDLVKFSSIVTAKTVQRCGLLDSIIVTDKSSTISTRNLLYDGTTGQVLVTQTYNEFKDPIYNTQILAYWTHAQMGPAYRNIGYSTVLQITDAKGLFDNSNGMFYEGDEVLMKSENITTIKAWVLKTNNNFYLRKSNGANVPTGIYNIKITRSGNTNQLSEVAGAIITRINPIIQVGSTTKLSFSEVLNASAITYKNHWQIYKLFEVELPQSVCNCEPVKISVVNTVFQLPNLVAGGDTILNNKKYSVIAIADTVRDITILNLKDNVSCHWSFKLNNPYKFTAPFPLNFMNSLTFVPVQIKNACGYSNYFKVQRGPTVIFEGYTDCVSLGKCSTTLTPPFYDCTLETNQGVNPYFTGIFGSYRPHKNFQFLTPRTNGNSRQSGTYVNFKNYWDLPLIAQTATPKSWLSAEEKSIVDPLGKTLQIKDTLGRYSSELYGYGHNIVIASAKNAKLSQIAAESFEDFSYDNRFVKNLQECRDTTHWSFRELVQNNAPILSIDNSRSHSGQNSLKMQANKNVKLTTKILSRLDTLTTDASPLYLPKPRDIITAFQPDTGEYIFSSWVNIPAQVTLASFTNTDINIKVGGSTPVSLLPSGPIIDGWQQMTGTFKVAVGTQQIEFALRSGLTDTFFDDIRIQPYKSSMQTYVYDPLNLRLHATLDDNNFATFYEYDQEGHLARVKKETERGIMTLKEVKSGLPKSENP